MADTNIIQTSFAAGEVSPAMYGRVDQNKFHIGAAVMRNFYVDYRGGASTRPGTQFIGTTGVDISSNELPARLQPFVFSSAIGQTYILVFVPGAVMFIKNPNILGPYNGSNAGFIQSGGGNYSVSTPYGANDLIKLNFSQIAGVMTICHPDYAPMDLVRITDTNWTLTATNTGSTPPTVDSPTSVTVTASAGGTTGYLYAVTSVDQNGNESPLDIACLDSISNAVDMAATVGSMSITWTPVANAKYYKVYKAIEAQLGNSPPFSANLGFVDYAYGTAYTDSNIVADFTQSPKVMFDPFANKAVIGYNISNDGANYVAGATTITVTDGTGTGAEIAPIMITTGAGGGTGTVGFGNSGGSSTVDISGLYIIRPGANYAAPTVAAVGAGAAFAATLILTPASGNYPACSGFFQQRKMYASTLNNPLRIFGSATGQFHSFAASIPALANDPIIFDLASQQINSIKFFLSMPGGLLMFTDVDVQQLTGGSANASNPLAVTPTSAVATPQSYFGCAQVPPIRIGYDVLYVQSQGSRVRDLAYNFFVNTYAGTDVSLLSDHLLYPRQIIQWAYQDNPTKVIWAVRDDGILLSFTYLKEQEIFGWARHDTQGQFTSVAVVREGTDDAIYVVVYRKIGGAGSASGYAYCVERMATRKLDRGVADSWCLDCAISTAVVNPQNPLIPSAITGTGINFQSTAGSSAGLGPSDVGKVISAGTGRGTITAAGLGNATVTITSPFATAPDNSAAPFIWPPGSWSKASLVSSVSGLGHLAGNTVYAVVDGAVQGPFVVSGGGSITLTSPGYDVTVGLTFSAQLQTLYLDVGGAENTIQSKRKKISAMTARVRDSSSFKMGTDFTTLTTYRPGFSSTDNVSPLPAAGPGLTTGDFRMIMPPKYDTVGSLCIQQDLPLPVTVLAVVPEVTIGDR